MPESKERIIIGPCPVCTRPHDYVAKVTVSEVAGFGNGSAAGEGRERSYVRFFTCPRVHERFQATISVTEPPGSRIKSVEIVGEEGGNE